MKRFFFIIAVLIVVLLSACILAWSNKASLAAYFTSRELNHVPVQIESLKISKGKSAIDQLWIGNPPHSQTKTAFTSKSIEINATWGEIFGSPLTIEDIVMENIFVGLEYYNTTGKANNWATILKKENKEEKPGRSYLIKRLVVRNLTVQLTKADGKTQTFPTIDEMVFYNISDETGFPIRDIEKAIFNMMLKELFKRLDLNQLLDTLIPGGSPLKLLPKIWSLD